MEKKYLYNDKLVEAKELFNEAELARIDQTQELFNAAGFGDIDLTLLTVLERDISRQKFYQVDPEKYVPFDHTTGGWADYITVLRSFANAEGSIDSWERGIDTDNARRGQVGVKLESASLKIHNLAKMISWSLFELRQSQQSGVWNVVTEKERARKVDHDISVQRAILLGDDDHLGLLNQPNVPVETAQITKPISQMTAAEFRTFLSTFLNNFFVTTNSTALPDTMVIPMSDFLGLGVAVDEQYPVFSTMLGRLNDVFRSMTGNEKAEIIPLVYCEPQYNNGNYKYVLYRRDFDTLRVYQPIDYNVVQGMTVDGMNYQNTAYSRISDVFVNRPTEMVYLTFPKA